GVLIFFETALRGTGGDLAQRLVRLFDEGREPALLLLRRTARRARRARALTQKPARRPGRREPDLLFALDRLHAHRLGLLVDPRDECVQVLAVALARSRGEVHRLLLPAVRPQLDLLLDRRVHLALLRLAELLTREGIERLGHLFGFAGDPLLTLLGALGDLRLLGRLLRALETEADAEA